jgi:hypothetical protein
MSTDGNEVLYACYAKSFGTELSQIRLVQEAECAGESKLPTQASSVFLVSEPAGSGFGGMAAINFTRAG